MQKSSNSQQIEEKKQKQRLIIEQHNIRIVKQIQIVVNNINKMLQQTIQEIFKLKEKIFKQVQGVQQFFKGSCAERQSGLKEQFGNIIKFDEKQNIKNCYLNTQHGNDSILQLFTNKITNITQSYQSKISQSSSQLQSQIKTFIKTLLISSSLNESDLQYKVFNKQISINQINHIIDKSSVIQSHQEILKLNQFFDDDMGMKVKRYKLLYKATENDFKMEKYYQMVCGKASTMVVARTEKGKKIGCWTPLVRYQNGKGNYWVKDQTQKSFLFSLTQNDKFKLTQPDKFAFLKQPTHQGIYFGYYCQLRILDNANTNQQCMTYLYDEGSFTNQKYKDNKQSYLKFNGNQTRYCTFKEWEVWEVEFYNSL